MDAGSAASAKRAGKARGNECVKAPKEVFYDA
jgi:hypothetical protein